MASDLAQRNEMLWISLLRMVAISSAFLRPLSPPNGSSIDPDWSTRKRKQPGFFLLISALYGMTTSMVLRTPQASRIPPPTPRTAALPVSKTAVAASDRPALSRGPQTARPRPHNPKIAGSNPAPQFENSNPLRTYGEGF